MPRFLSALPLALTLAALSAPAVAGPTISTQGPDDGGAPAAGVGAGFVLDCRINGRLERYTIVGTALVDRPGSVIQLDTGVFSILTDQGNVLLTEDSAQITGGPDAGKWDCVRGSATPAPTGNPGTAPIADPGALAALQQRLDAAQTAIAASEARRNAALAEIDALQAELATSLHMEQTEQAARLRAEAILAERDADLAEARERIQAGELERADLEAALAEAEAANAVLSAELAAAQAEEDMTESEMDGDGAPGAEVMSEEAADAGAEAGQGAAMMFDADAALAMLEAAEISDIARAALVAAVEQARDNPDMAAEVMARLQNAMGQ